MAKNEAKIRFTAETSEFNNQIKQSNSEMSKLRAEMKLNDEQMKTAGKSVEGLEQKQKLLESQLTASQKKTEALSQKVQAAKEIYGENSAEVMKLQTQLLTAQTAEEKLQRQVAQCNQELESQRDAATRTKTATEQLSDRIGQQQKDVDKLKQEYIEAVLKFGETSDAAKDLAGKIDIASGQLKENKKAMKDASGAADELDKSLDNASGNDGEGFTVFKAALGDLISDGIQFAIGKVNELVDYMFGLPEATREIRQDFATLTTAFDNMGYSTEVAEETWRGLYGIFGEDDRAIETANNIAKIARNEEDLNKWVTITTGIWGTYQDSLPVEGLAEAAQETAKTGTVTGGLADALNWSSEAATMFAGFMSKDVVTAEDAFNEALKQCNSEQERQQLITDTLTVLYGEASDTYKEASGAMLEAKDAAASNILVENALATALEPVTTEYQHLANDMKANLLPAAEAFSGWATGALEWMREHPTLVKAMAAAIGVLAIGVSGLAIGWGIYTAAQWAANSALLASPITWIVLAIVAAIAALVAIIVVVVEKWDEIKALFSKFADWCNEKIIQPLKELGTNIKNKFTEIVDNVKQWGKNILAKGKEAVTNFIDAVVTFFKELPSKMWTWLSNGVSKIAEWGSNLKAKGKDAATKLLTTVVSTIKTIPSKIATVGKDLAAGVWNGISNSLTWIKNKIKTWVGNVTDFIKKLFGIQSPSTVMRDEVGAQLAAGVAVGIEKNTSEVQKKAEEMSKKVLDAAKKRLDDYKVYNDLSLADEIAYWKQVCTQCVKGTDSRLEAEKKYLEAKANLNNQLLTAEENLQKRLDGITKKVTDRQKELVNAFDLFDGFSPERADISTSEQLHNNLFMEIKDLEKYGETVEQLEKRIGGTKLFDYLKALGIDAAENLMYVNRMTDAELKEYSKLFEIREGIAGNIAAEQLEDEVIADTQTAYEEFGETCNGVGVEISGSVELMKTNVITSLTDLTTSIQNSIVQIQKQMKELRESMGIPAAQLNQADSDNKITVVSSSAEIPTFAKGGILTKPLLNIAGEAGPEAIIPIDKLQTYISGAIEKTMQIANMNSLVYAIEDLANRAIELNINGHKFATATAGDTDVVNGSRMQLSKRGLAR